jgi:hypothetical protein
MVYLSDVSYIPARTWDIMIDAIKQPTPESSSMSISSKSSASGTPSNDVIGPDKVPFPANAVSLPHNTLPCLILDTLRLEPHVSHLSFLQSLSVAQKLSAAETYLVGFTHPAAHAQWEAACEEVQGTRAPGSEDAFLEAVEKSAVRQGDAMQKVWREVRDEWKGFVRPGYDGQVIKID